jgi:hypothetical protein
MMMRRGERYATATAALSLRKRRARLRPTPRSADRARSPARVSQKREYFKYSPETIGDFALRLCKCGDQRPNLNRKKAAVGGHICGLYEHYLQLSDWLAGGAVLIAPVSTRIPC